MADQRAEAARKFAEEWKNRGYEKGETQPFWLSLLHRVYGIENPEQYIRFETQVKLDTTSFIDAYITDTSVMVEQKSIGKNLNQPIKQSDGTFLTPFQQAKRYISGLPRSEHPRWLITCNFAEFWVYDMEQPNNEPEKILLKDLEKEYYRLEFLVDKDNHHLQKEMEVSVKAGELVGKLYDAFAKQYADPTSPKALKSLNVLCVRLVFCLYAENADIFGDYGMFHNYMNAHKTNEMRRALVDLFHILNTKVEHRDRYLANDNPALAAFPYVNGGLFAEEDIDIPPFTEEIRDILLNQASAGFNWSRISPTIFGAVFESTINPETRRSGGMHYTSIENIHKVIDPLFLDDLKKEFAEVCQIQVKTRRRTALVEFQNKLASLTFLDPACGSGNFHTESYISLRRLENSVLRELYADGQIALGGEFSPIKVSLSQFYGIEINDFAVSVARTALWIAEHQMLKETETIVGTDLNFLPLKSYTNIVEGNALRLDWESVVPKDKLNYIMGNPPFSGMKYQSKSQKEDLLLVSPKLKGLDYVSAWFYKSAQLMEGTDIQSALVSTNSITQGEQVVLMWQPLFNDYGIHINFAHRTFRWDSESNSKAHVHCVIIGFSCSINKKPKVIYADNRKQIVGNINGYLMDAEDIFIKSRNQAICPSHKMVAPNKPCDYNHLKVEPDEYRKMIADCPVSKQYLKRMVGAQELIRNIERWCLWLVNCPPDKLRQMSPVMERVRLCKEARIAANTPESLRLAETPTLFREQLNPSNYLIIPCVSSENRKYIPISFLNQDYIPVMGTLIVPEATMYEFGVLTSNVHNGWMRAVCGRLEMRYRYSKDIVYNNFPWPTPTEEQTAKIEQTAQAILDARALYPDASLADLYDETSMPPELRKAHQDNDRAVMAAYGWGKNDPAYTSESACVAELMKMYQKLTKIS